MTRPMQFNLANETHTSDSRNRLGQSRLRAATRVARLAILLAVMSTSLVFGQALEFERTGPDGKELDVLKSWELTLTPAREPQPALQFSLWPRYWDRKYGDATSHYYRALLMHAELPSALKKDYTEKSPKWLANKLDDAAMNEMRTWLAAHQRVIQELETATYRERLELDLRLRDLKGLEAISFVLPDAQATRELARLLQVKARLEIAEKKYEQAIGTLCMGYRLAQAAAQTPTLIHDLIGMSIGMTMTEEVTRLMASPDAPNLYWAITALPRPLIDVREGFEHESGLPEQVFPFLRDVETAEHTPDQWRKVMTDAYQSLHELSGDYAGKPGPLSPIATAVWMMKEYPEAKRFLVETGMTKEKVDAMSVGQVLAIYTARAHRIVYDEVFKWTLLPPAQVHDRWNASFEALRERKLYDATGPSKDHVPIARILMPAVLNVSLAPLRLERQLAVLRIIEAIRMYAANHGGSLPASLSDVHEAVIPLDPMFEKPFPYRVQGKTAILEIPPRTGLPPGQDGYRFVMKIKE